MTKRERDLRSLLEFRCVYCGQFKSECPPEWCVRRHEGYEAKQAELARSLGR